MTDRGRTAVGARVLALGASVAATLALMGGMAAGAQESGTASPPPATSDPGSLQRSSPPSLHATTAPDRKSVV